MIKENLSCIPYNNLGDVYKYFEEVLKKDNDRIVV
jgi:hypothetical protein